MSIYNLDMKHEVTQNLLKRVKGGLRTHIFMRPRVKNMEAAVNLMRGGADVYAHRYLHAKAMLGKMSGKMRGIVMTANVESRGLDTGFETGVQLTPAQCESLRTLMESWPKTFHFRLTENLPRGQVTGECLLWDGRGLSPAIVGGTIEKDLGTIQAKSLDSMAETEPKEFPIPDEGEVQSLPHEIVYRWTVLPPTLPKGAQRLKSEEDVDLFQHKGKKYILAKSPDDAKRVTQRAKDLGADIVAESHDGKPSAAN
jgi:cardiolipin synthase